MNNLVLLLSAVCRAHGGTPSGFRSFLAFNLERSVEDMACSRPRSTLI